MFPVRGGDGGIAPKWAFTDVMETYQMKTYQIAIDAGNFDLKYWAGEGEPKAIRSIKFVFPQSGRRKALKHSESSPLLEFKGRQYHFGYRAYQYRSQSATVDADKAQLALLNALACIDPPEPQFDLVIHTSHPSPELKAESIRSALMGTHAYTRNNVKTFCHVKRVEVAPEGFPAYLNAKSLGLVPDRGLSLIIDIGGGTVCVRLIDNDDEIVESVVWDKGGGYELAARIASDGRLIEALGDRPDPSIVMDGFANGTHYYQELARASWREYFDDYRKEWFTELFNKIRTQFQPFAGQITRMLLTGGSSLLVSDLIPQKAILKQIPDPRFANVRGLYPAIEAGQKAS